LPACKPLVDGAEGTQQRFWVAPPRGEQEDFSGEIGQSLESSSALVDHDWSMDSASEGLYTLATTGSCLPFRSDLSLQVDPPATSATLSSNALRPPSPPLLGCALAGGPLPLFGTVGTPPRESQTLVQTEAQPRRIASHASTPQIPVQSPGDARWGTRLRAPSPDDSGRSSRISARSFDQRQVSGLQPRSPRTNNRAGTPLVNRSRSATPSEGPKRVSTGGKAGATRSTSISSSDRRRLPQRPSRERAEIRVSSETGRRARSVTPEDGEDGRVASSGTAGHGYHATPVTPGKNRSSLELEVENYQLRVEVSELRAELRDVFRELQARTQDLREVSALLARRQGNPSTPNLGECLVDGRTGSGAQLSSISTETPTNNSFGHNHLLVSPSTTRSTVVRAMNSFSLGSTPPPTPSPRADGRVLR